MGWPSMVRSWSTLGLALNIVGMIFYSLPKLWVPADFPSASAKEPRTRSFAQSQ
jgi:hypothetical protein